MRVLVIGDDQHIVGSLTFCLKARFPKVTPISVAKWPRGLQMVKSQFHDMVIVDSPLPDTDTSELVTKIRALSDVPLIVLRRVEGDIDGVKALEAGADEYVTKPFSPAELLAKVKALLRRTKLVGFEPDRIVSMGNEFIINLNTCQVFLSGKQVQLTPVEFNLLSELVRNECKVLNLSVLSRKIFGSEGKEMPHLIRKHIHRLRSKLERDPRNPQMLLTERGKGYKFVKTELIDT